MIAQKINFLKDSEQASDVGNPMSRSSCTFSSFCFQFHWYGHLILPLLVRVPEGKSERVDVTFLLLVDWTRLDCLKTKLAMIWCQWRWWCSRGRGTCWPCYLEDGSHCPVAFFLEAGTSPWSSSGGGLIYWMWWMRKKIIRGGSWLKKHFFQN